MIERKDFSSSCRTKLPCGHLCKEEGDTSLTEVCQEGVETKLKCGHTNSVSCYELVGEITCNVKCELEMHCNFHTCQVSCGTPHHHNVCEANYTILCEECEEYHDVPCNQADVLSSVPCGLSREIVFSCGHFYQYKCPSKPPNRCTEACVDQRSSDGANVQRQLRSKATRVPEPPNATRVQKPRSVSFSYESSGIMVRDRYSGSALLAITEKIVASSAVVDSTGSNANRVASCGATFRVRSRSLELGTGEDPQNSYNRHIELETRKQNLQAMFRGQSDDYDCRIAKLETGKRNLKEMYKRELQAIDDEIQQLQRGESLSFSNRGIPKTQPPDISISLVKTNSKNVARRTSFVRQLSANPNISFLPVGPNPNFTLASCISLSTTPVMKTEILMEADHQKLLANQSRVSRAASSVAVKIESDNGEYKTVNEKVKSYVNFQVDRIIKIVHAESLSNYTEGKELCFDPLNTELKVYSTTVSRMERIAREGFSETDLEPGVYGHGIYFLENYAEDVNIFDNACVLLCEVAVGRSLATEASLPNMSKTILNEEGYDSVHGRKNPNAVTERCVIYSSNQVYAKYAVFFEPEALDIVSYSLQPTRFVDVLDQIENQYRAVENELFRNRVRDSLRSVEYVKNCYAEQRFLAKHAEFSIMYGEEAAEAKKVMSFHGTGRTSIEKIIQNNFDLAMVGTHGLKVGKGVYFSKSPATALSYSLRRDGASKTIIACYILPGKAKTYEGREMVCDSYIDTDIANVTVIKRSEQILPVFKLTFNNVP